MKTMIMKNLSRLGLAALVVVGLSSCGKIPSAYRGTFLDSSTGTKIELTASEGTLTEAGGRTIKNDASTTLDFDALNQGQAGIYLLPNPDNEKEMFVYWMVPQVASRAEQYGYVTLRGEILYTRMRTDIEDPVPTISAMHCLDGWIELYQPTKTWKGGCGPGAQELTAKRMAE